MGKSKRQKINEQNSFEFVMHITMYVCVFKLKLGIIRFSLSLSHSCLPFICSLPMPSYVSFFIAFSKFQSATRILLMLGVLYVVIFVVVAPAVAPFRLLLCARALSSRVSPHDHISSACASQAHNAPRKASRIHACTRREHYISILFYCIYIFNSGNLYSDFAQK